MKTNKGVSDPELEALLREKLREDLGYYVEFFRRIVDEELDKLSPDDLGLGMSAFLDSPEESSVKKVGPKKFHRKSKKRSEVTTCESTSNVKISSQ